MIIKAAQHKLQDTYKREKRAYLQKIIDQSSGSPAELYQLCKFKSKPKSDLPKEMTFRGHPVAEHKISEYMTTHFDEAFGYIADPIYTDNVAKQITKLWSANYIHDASVDLPISITVSEINAEIGKINVRKAAGAGELSTSFLLQYGTLISPVLAQLFSAQQQLRTSPCVC